MINFPTRVALILACTGLTWALAQRAAPVPDRPPATPVQTAPPAPAAPASITMDPHAGPAGTLVTVKGVGLNAATKVLFSPAVEADFTVIDETTVKTRVPAGAQSGPVQVVTPKGTLKSLEPFQVPGV